MTETSRLNGKDLINIGVYTAIVIGVIFVIGMLNAFPPMYPISLVIWPLACAIPMMLYYTKIRKFGMLTITGVIVGAFFFMVGYTWVALVCYSVAGFAADLILKLGGYHRFIFHALSYAVFCLALIAPPLLLWLAGPAYWDGIEESMGSEYAEALRGFMPPWMLYVGLPVLFLSGLAGAFLGRKMLRKHFVRAGIA
ncbi:MptD family putative ECF transporter S component [uncultured Propionibacterium sp.]|uniref:MptD family putative ECF transporter S component n=1 Tax=uncultured Propionibacterium sp. TaxID=218066 RepID=UPI00292D3E1C|nr:MptD family putative ECF transporter S component [uncultured Propionibacterium sp.]